MLSDNNKKLYRKCAVCSCEYGQIIHSQRFEMPQDYTLPRSYDLICCKECGFVFADADANQKDYEKYYETNSIYESKEVSIGGSCPWDIKRYERIASDLSNILSDRKAKILDIGCANGGLLTILKNRGYFNLSGLDPSPVCAANTKQLGFNAYQASLFSDLFMSHTISSDHDCIVFSHILEHVFDINGSLERALSKLKKNGLLYLEVPDAAEYINYYKAPFYFFENEHINHFDKNSLTNLLKKFNLNTIVSGKKSIESSTTDRYPAIFGIYEKSGLDNKDQEIAPDFTLRDSLVDYIEKSKSDPIFKKISEVAESGESIMIWGAGNHSFKLLANSDLGRCNIAGFIDKDIKKQGKRLNNYAVFSPDKLLGHKGSIAISSVMHSNDIVDEIKAMGLNNRIIVLK
ncbi:methyltransferase domain-containing protein [Candidatus Omnitrophota bacterium]